MACSIVPVSFALGALLVDTGVPGASRARVPSIIAVAADSVGRPGARLIVRSFADPLPETDALARRLVRARYLPFNGEVFRVRRLGVLGDILRVVHVDRVLTTESHELHTPLHLVGEVELLS